LFLKEGASQCGFCTPGFIVSLTGFFLSDNFNDDILNSIDGNICRCTGHNSIIRAAEYFLSELKDIPEDFDYRIKYLIEKNIIPEFFQSVKEKLIYKQKNIELKNNKNLQIFLSKDLMRCFHLTFLFSQRKTVKN